MINSGKAVEISQKIKEKSLIEEELLLKLLRGNQSISSPSFLLKNEIKSNIFEILSNARIGIFDSSIEKQLDRFFEDSKWTDLNVQNYFRRSSLKKINTLKEFKSRILSFIANGEEKDSLVTNAAMEFVEKNRNDILKNRFSPEYLIDEINQTRTLSGLTPLTDLNGEMASDQHISNLSIDKNLTENIKVFDNMETLNQINYNINNIFGYRVKIEPSSKKSVVLDGRNIFVSHKFLTANEDISTGYILIVVNALFKIASQYNTSTLGKMLAENNRYLQAENCNATYNKLSYNDKIIVDSAFIRATNLISTINLARLSMKPKCFAEVEKSLIVKFAECLKVLQDKINDPYVVLALANNIGQQSEKLYKKFKLKQSFLTEKYADTYSGFGYDFRAKNFAQIIYPGLDFKRLLSSDRLTNLSNDDNYYSFDYKEMITKPIYELTLKNRNSEFINFQNSVKESDSVKSKDAHIAITQNLTSAMDTFNKITNIIQNVKLLRKDQLSEIINLYASNEVLSEKCKWLMSEDISDKVTLVKPKERVNVKIPTKHIKTVPQTPVPATVQTVAPVVATPPAPVIKKEEIRQETKSPQETQSTDSEKVIKQRLNSGFKKIINRLTKTVVVSLAVENLKELTSSIKSELQGKYQVSDPLLITSLQTLFTVSAEGKSTVKDLANIFKTNPAELPAVALLKLSYDEGFVNQLSKILSEKAIEIKLKDSTLSDQEVLSKTLEKLDNKFTKALKQKHDVEIDMLNFQYPIDRDSEEYRDAVNSIDVKYYGDILVNGEFRELNDNLLHHIIKDTLISELQEIKSGLKSYKNSPEKMKQCANQLFYEQNKSKNSEWIDEN